MKNNARTYKQNKSWLLIAMIAFVCLYWSNSNSASSDNANLGVSVNISAKCAIRSSNVQIAFGAYEPISANELEARSSNSSFDVKCTRNTTTEVGISEGLYSSQAVSTSRAMSDGNGNYVSYEIYSDASRSTVWTTTNTVSFTDLGGIASTLPVYAAIPPGQDVVSGEYSDTVTLTITY